MKRFSQLALVAIMLALLWSTASPPSRVAAFDHSWPNYYLLNVIAGEYGLWDDAPAGRAGEAGLLWFLNTEDLDETIAYKTTDVNILTNTYPILKARADISDGMDFRVGYAQQNPDATCTFPAALKWPNKQANRGYLEKSYTLPAGTTIRAICIWLTDNTDAIYYGRTAALIAFIRLVDADGKIGWNEDFAGSP